MRSDTLRFESRRPKGPVQRAGWRPAISIKRAYDPAGAEDGTRVLVDGLWPRGLTKTQVAADFWLKEAAPSAALRRWYGHDPRRWDSFRAKYRRELAERTEVLDRLDGLRRRGPITLVYGARDEARNQAVVLREVLEERRIAQSRSRRAPYGPRGGTIKRKGTTP